MPTAVGNIIVFYFFFFYFSEKIRFEISCEPSNKPTIYKQYQALFSLKNKKKKSNSNFVWYNLKAALRVKGIL